MHLCCCVNYYFFALIVVIVSLLVYIISMYLWFQWAVRRDRANCWLWWDPVAPARRRCWTRWHSGLITTWSKLESGPSTACRSTANCWRPFLRTSNKTTCSSGRSPSGSTWYSRWELLGNRKMGFKYSIRRYNRDNNSQSEYDKNNSIRQLMTQILARLKPYSLVL